MGKASRDKGKLGELEVVNLAKSLGIHAQRTAPLQAATGSDDADVALALAGQYVEVKRRERMEVVKWCREAEAAAGTRVPVVAFRPSREPWRVALPLETYLRMVQELEVLRAASRGLGLGR